MTMNDTIENWALHAFADGELQGEEKNKIEMLLASDPAARAALAEIRGQKAELHKTFDGVLAESVPAHILRAASMPVVTKPWRGWAVAATVAVFVIGAAAGWAIRGLDGGYAQAEALPMRALDAFTVYGVEVRHPVEVQAADKEHLQMWLSKRVGVPFNVPDLTAQGYSLIGGRLLTEHSKPAGMLMYEGADKRRLVIYVSANAAHSDAPLKIEQHGPLVTCFWLEPDLAYALAGPQTAAEMAPLAQAAHEGFDQKG